MRFVYSIIRFVPEPSRGEFVNVGAVVGSEETSEWAIRQVSNPVRARAIDERQVLDRVWGFFTRVGQTIDEWEAATETPNLFGEVKELSEDWLAELYQRHRNIVQLTAPTPMVADDAESALDRVFDEMILDPAQRTHPFEKKHRALGAVRRAYKDNLITRGHGLYERSVLRSAHHRERFDFAVGNGTAVQLTQTWSFQVPDQESLAEQVKAWGWTVADVQRAGGQIALLDGRTVEVPREVDISVVYVPPQEGQQASALSDALYVFDTLKVEPFTIEEAANVGTRAHDLMVKEGYQLGIVPEAR